MTPETGSLQIISSQAPIAHAALSRLTWGPRSVQLLAGGAIGLIGLGLIPVIGPFSAIIASIGAAILLHGIFYGESLPLQIPALIPPKTPETATSPINPKPLLDASINKDLNNNFWQTALGLGALCYGLICRNGYFKSMHPEGPVVPYPSGGSPSLEEGLQQSPYQFPHPNKKPLAIGYINEESKILAQLSRRQYPIGTITLTDTPSPPGLKPSTHDLTQIPKFGWNPFSLNADPKRNNTDNTSLQIAGKSTPSQSPSNREGIQDILKLIQAAFKNSKTFHIQLFDNNGFCLFNFEGNPMEITIFKQDPQIPNSASTALAIYAPYRKDRNPEEPFLELIRQLLEQDIRFSIRGDDPVELKILTYVPAISNPVDTLLDLSNPNLKNLIGCRIPNNTPLQITELPLPNILDTNPTGIFPLLPKLPLSSLPTRKISSSINPQLTAALLETPPLTVSKTLLPDQPIFNQNLNLAIPLIMLTGVGMDAAISAVKGSVVSNNSFNFNATEPVLDTSPFLNTTQHLALNGSSSHPTNDNAPLAIPENPENRLFNIASAIYDVTRIAMTDYAYPALTEYVWPATTFTVQSVFSAAITGIRDYAYPALTEYVWPATAFTARTVFSAAITGIRDYIMPPVTEYLSWKWNKTATRLQNGIRGWSSIISMGATEYLFPALTGYASWKYDKVVTRFQNGIRGWSSILLEELLPATAFTARTVFDTVTTETAKYVSWSRQDLKRPVEEDRKLEPIGDTALQLATESSLETFKDLMHRTWNDLTWLLEMTHQWSREQFHALLKSNEGSVKSPTEPLHLEHTIISSASTEKDKTASPIALYNPPERQDSFDPNTISHKASAGHRKWILDQIYALLKPKIAPVQLRIEELSRKREELLRSGNGRQILCLGQMDGSLDPVLQHASPVAPSLITTANLTNLFCPANMTNRATTPTIISEQETIERFTDIETKRLSIPPSPVVIYPIENNKDSSYPKAIFDTVFSNKKTIEIKFYDIKKKEITLVFDPSTNTASIKDEKTILSKTKIFAFTSQDLKELLTTLQSNNQQFTATSQNLQGTTTTLIFDPKDLSLEKLSSIGFDKSIEELSSKREEILPSGKGQKKPRTKKQRPLKKRKPSPEASIKNEPFKSGSSDNDLDIEAFLRGVDATAQKLNDDIKKFEESKANVATLMNDRSPIDSFIKKRAQIEECINNGKVKTEQLENELKKIANTPEITNIINETEKTLIENNDKKLNHAIEKFKDLISSRPIENIDALFKEIAIIEENLKRDEARFNESQNAVNKIMNTQNEKSKKEPTHNFSKTIILAVLFLSISEQIESVHGDKLIFKSLSQDSGAFRPPFRFSEPEGSPLPPTA